MGKFTTQPARTPTVQPVHPVIPTVATTGHVEVNPQGGAGYTRTAKSDLFLLAVTNMVSEDTFYEGGKDRDNRFVGLVRQVAVEDPAWIARFVPWLRETALMRSASIVTAAEAVHALLTAARPLPDGVNLRALVSAALQRADEPAEMLAYWQSAHGRNIPKPVKRGVADAFVRLVNERAALKYDGTGQAWRLGDVIDLVHPTPSAPWQSALFKILLDERHGHGHTPDVPYAAGLHMLSSRGTLEMIARGERREYLAGSPDPGAFLKRSGVTWEWLSSWLPGGMDAQAWEWVIPSMGYMALIRNLRNFDQAGVSDEVAAQVAARISDPEEVAKSRQFPLRFLSAYQAAPSLRWGHALEKAVQASLANVPSLPGRTLILVDRSGSMWDRLSKRSTLNRADAAAMFGTALAMRAERADLVQFGADSYKVTLGRGESLLKVLDKFESLGGTYTGQAIRKHFRSGAHDRVVIVTDEQAGAGWYGYGAQVDLDPLGVIPASVPVYTWNLAGYQHGHSETGTRTRVTFGGLTDAAFRLIPIYEGAQDGDPLAS